MVTNRTHILVQFLLCVQVFTVYCYSAKSTGVETLKMTMSFVSKSMDKSPSKHRN